MKNLLILPLLLLTFLVCESLTAQNYTLHEGELDGAPFKVVVPDGWDSGNVFFHVHGWRPDDAPHEADIDPDDPFYQAILGDGWVIGRTAFLENGVDHDAHTRALYDLKDWINQIVGPVRRLIMEGESTAGTLMLRITEQNPDLADGVIAKGAFINVEDETHDSYLEAVPNIPAILMSNLTELDGPISYAARAEGAVVEPALRPLLRPGHVNVNREERLAAINAMQQWLDEGTISPVSDGTRPLPARDTGTIARENSIENRVVSVNPFYGNAFLGFHPEELEEFGIEQGDDFLAEIHGKMWKVYYGVTYDDVPIGDWVAFPTASDTIMLVRNHRHAVRSAGISVGDTIRLMKLENE